MAKSIRSKIKRKNRSEFRSTIGEAAYQANMEKVQHKLKECVEKQSLESLDKLSGLLASGANDDMRTNDNDDSMDVPAIYATDVIGAAEIRGENKVPAKKLSKRRKHKLARKVGETKGQRTGAGEKRRPRFFCQF